jgi:phosphate transport system substrate-binding protein
LGKYEVIARLGKGGMAQVHLAVARGPGGFNKLVVLKSLESQDEAFRRMFLDEARLAALLHHPNVVNTYEVSETDGQYFIAMEYLDGQPLDKLIRETKKLGLLLPPRLCVRIIADALSGLHYTHELRDYAGAPLSVVHRDISPHNLFLTYEGNVKLLDFGVAKSAAKTAETDIGVLKGKLAYMAPEQAATLPVDRRADVFAIGAVLWELLTLQRLRQADSAAGVLSEAIHGGLPDLQQARPDVGRRLESVLWLALANQPARRYQTAQEMRDALVDYLAAEPCSQEDLADFMQRRFGALRAQMQEQIAECLRGTEARDPAIFVTQEEEASSLLRQVTLGNRALPLLDSGSLSLRGEYISLGNDELTTPLAPDALQQATLPPSPGAESNSVSRSRSITFAEEGGPNAGRPGRILLLGAVVASLVLVWLWLRRPGAELALRGDASGVQGAPAAQELLLRLHGSNTIGQELAPRLAEAFLKQRGFAAVERGGTAEHGRITGRDPQDGKVRQIEVVAQGSATAFAGLATEQCDVGMSSRRIKPEEAALLRSKGLGDLESAAGEHVLGLDGIAVIVHPNSTLQRIDLGALRRLFTAELTDMAAVGGPAGPVHLYARDDRSGTFDTFKHLVVGDRPLSDAAQRFSDSAELSSAVARDPHGIGFIGIPYVRAAKAVAVGESGATSLYPSAFTVATEGYALSRRLYLYLPVEKLKPLALDFVNFALSSEGQAVVKASGFVDLTLHSSAGGACEHCPARYAALSRSGKRLSLDFRFRKGSAELDSRGLRDLDRLLAFLRDQNGSRLVLVGFSDARGSVGQNLKLSQERAKKIAAELRQRGVPGVELEAMGHELPVASNDSESGREKNRRVEVWLR